MTIKEMKERIAKLEKERFYLDMKDHWTRRDFDKDDELLGEIKNLKKMIERG